MTPAERAAALARCDAEIAELGTLDPDDPESRAFLAAMGLIDWLNEKRAIEAEAKCGNS